MIDREGQLRVLGRLLARSPVVALLGARQVGKTTLARALVAGRSLPASFFDLERAQDLARLADPELALAGLRGIVVLDEIQRRPDLFPALRVLADRPRKPARLLVLGSASPELLRQSSESLAGRIAYHELSGLRLDEVGIDHMERLWLRGGFPRSYTARSNRDSGEWRRDFIRMFLERDVPQFGISIPSTTLERFWAMLAHYHGQIWNASEFARSFGVSHHVTRGYLEALVATFMVRIFRPWTENIKKRQVRSPKVYIRDPGAAPQLPRRRLDCRSGAPSADRRVMGGVRARGGDPAARGDCRAVLLLGDAYRRRTRLARCRRGPPARVRDQADHRTAAHPVDALGLR